ncbi:MAG: hypothetical protein BWX72_00792 [Firmicutes bacterium ADurb.Bin080]|nr:MAG: hypothetical protein BWX72_00792 [Firmicutes bacterium ADurb.Bin080]
MAQRIRRTANEREYERVIDDLITQGYVVVSRGESSANLIKRGKKEKHLLVFLLTFWWTLGIGNIIYAILPNKVVDDVLVRIDQNE